jgi:uncharacterized protein (UPF0147 family)
VADFNINEWDLGRSQLADALQRRKIEEMMADPRLQELLANTSSRNQLTQQQAAEFPVRLQGQQLSNDTQNFNLRRAESKVPLEDFSNNVNLFGGNAAGESFVQNSPELAQQLFGGRHRAMSGGAEGPPDLRGEAQRAGAELYAGGSPNAAKVSLESRLIPMQERLIAAQGDQQVRAAEVGRAGSAAEHAKNREASGAGVALQNFTTNPALANRLPILESMAAAAKTPEQARTIINELDSVRNQIRFSLQSAQTIGSTMGGPQSLAPQLQAMANAALSRIDDMHRKLFDKYWGPKTKESNVQGLPWQNSMTETDVGP